MTKEKKEIALAVISLIHDCIRDAGEQGIPSGHLYSMLIEKISLDTYQGVISVLLKAGKVRESNFILTSI
jgi:hypothetical protein